jgi:hypothetical protein
MQISDENVTINARVLFLQHISVQLGQQSAQFKLPVQLDNTLLPITHTFYTRKGITKFGTLYSNE